jgi:hypothetical protein
MRNADYNREQLQDWEKELLDKKQLVLPRIGCGIDGLDWDKVREMIKEVFAETDWTIHVCYI